MTRGDAWLALALVLGTGYVDGFGLHAYGTFLSFMSGNTTSTGYNIGHGRFAAALPTGVAILGFVFGATIGTTLTLRVTRPRRLVIATVAALQALVLALSALGTLASLAGIVVMSTAMGMLNRAVTHIGGQSISLTFVTGTLSQIGNHLASAMARVPLDGAAGPRDTHARRAAELASVWCAFIAGATIAGIVAPRLGKWTLGPSVVMLAALAIVPTSQTSPVE
jgi:uncharacterized membrane protein YoaK (UPF0700 family)